MKAVGIDLETTGVDIFNDKPTQIGMVLYDLEGGGHSVIMNTYCNPGRPISQSAAELTGITDEVVKNMPGCALVAWQAQELLRAYPPDLVVTFNGGVFDLPILDQVLGRRFWDGQHIDVLDVAYRHGPNLPSRKLGDLHSHYFGYSLEGAHDAVVDILGMLNVLTEMARTIGLSIPEILEDMRTPRPWKTFPFGKHRDAPLAEVPPSYAKWLDNQNAGKPMRPDMRASLDVILGVL